MPIFELNPLDVRNPAWFSFPLESYIGRAIVRAPDEGTARQLCSIALGGWLGEMDMDAPSAPIEAAWSSDALVSCHTIDNPAYPKDGPLDVLFPHPLRPEARIAVEQFARILATAPARA